MIVDHPVISLQCRNSAPLFRGCRGKRLPFEASFNKLSKQFVRRRPTFFSVDNNLLSSFFDDNFICEGLLKLGLFCNSFLCNILYQLWGIVITSYQLWGTVIILCQLWGIVITSYQLWGTVIIPYQLWGIVITCYLFSIICSRLFSLNLSLFFSCFFLYAQTEAGLIVPAARTTARIIEIRFFLISTRLLFYFDISIYCM